MKRLVSFFGEHSPVFDELNERIAGYAAEKGIEYVWLPQKPYDEQAVIQALTDADAGLIDVEPYGENIFGKIGSRCRLVVRFGVGYDRVDLAAASRHGICAARTTGTLSDSVAEMALAQTLALRRNLRKNRETVQSGVWTKNIGRTLVGSTVGIVGFGAIGQSLARLLSGFGCRILVYSRSATDEQAAAFGAECATLEELFSQSDVVSIHVPYSEQTHGLVDAQLLARMKPDAVLICTARGKIVDESALYDALVHGRLAGAGLDVFEQEPAPKNNPLFALENVVLTPHVASQTKEALWATYRKAVDIVDDFFAGRELPEADLLNPDYKNFCGAACGAKNGHNGKNPKGDNLR